MKISNPKLKEMLVTTEKYFEKFLKKVSVLSDFMEKECFRKYFVGIMVITTILSIACPCKMYVDQRDEIYMYTKQKREIQRFLRSLDYYIAREVENILGIDQ